MFGALSNHTNPTCTCTNYQLLQSRHFITYYSLKYISFLYLCISSLAFLIYSTSLKLECLCTIPGPVQKPPPPKHQFLLENSLHTYSTFYETRTLRSTSQVWIHLLLWGGFYYTPHFTDKEVETQRNSVISHGPPPGRQQSRICTQASGFQIHTQHCSSHHFTSAKICPCYQPYPLTTSS